MSDYRLTRSTSIKYAIGQLGWSLLFNIVSLQLVYFYLPPDGDERSLYVPQLTFLGILNIIAVLALSGRIIDAVTDPWIAHISDNLRNKKGRRIPLMRMAIIPACIFLVLLFVPWVAQVSAINVAMLLVMQALFFISLTFFVTPYYALLPALAPTSRDKLNISTYISVTYALGIMIAAQLPVLSGALESVTGNGERAFQLATGIMAVIAAICMAICAYGVEEPKLTETTDEKEYSIWESIRHTLKNEHFKFYIIADCTYFTAITVVLTGILYYLTVLLGLPENQLGLAMTLMIVVSFVFYPVVNYLAKMVGKKRLIVISFVWMAVVFTMIYFMGSSIPLSSEHQIYIFIIFYAIPLSALSILPNAVLADIADHDAKVSGVSLEGMFFAARMFMQKLGQSLGVFLFAACASLGRSVGDDWGLRLSGIVCTVLCIAAAVAFSKYKEYAVLVE